MKQMTYVLFSLLGLLTINSAVGQPNVPGFDIEVYAEVSDPFKLAFDPSGILYVGNNANTGVEKIRRVGLGGAPVTEYGDTYLTDPDSVAFDASGAISGTPGSVLVGDDGNLVAILPDETTVTLLTDLGNVANLDFDRTGRLVMADQDIPFRLLVTTGGTPVELGKAFLAATVDGANNIYSAYNLGQIAVYASDGTQLPDLRAPDWENPPPELGFFRGLEFGPYNSFWKGHLIAVSDKNNLYRITPDGSATLLGSFDLPGDVAFGPDGALYVSDLGTDKIYRITPVDVLTVSIDIKLGSDKNPVNPRSKGKLPVAILTTDSFDANTVDANTVRFGTGEAEPVRYRLSDVDDDGDLDLALKFKTQDTGIACGDTEATLTGETFDGQSFTGTDSIKTVSCKSN